MPTVYRIAVRATRGEKRGKFRVMLTAKEGTYALSVPQTVFGKLMYQIVKKKPLTINFGRGKNALQLKDEDINLKGIRPLGKTARKAITYTPLRPPRPKKKEKEETPAPVPKTPEVASPPPEITSALFAETEKTKTTPAKSNRKNNKKKQTVATAA